MAVEPNRWGIIYNPKAGSRKAQKRWKEIRDYMELRNVKFDYVQSEGFGSVERLARTLANNGYRTIVVVGGDGAINDAINGIMYSVQFISCSISIRYFYVGFIDTRKIHVFWPKDFRQQRWHSGENRYH